ncbi:hypothetical protein L1987_24925 [Smallanthus sonchifolius]|uniref:Uncharacterized protein n=1 Tax=Smallanthus sonchifolius TaxID=185202 RepID=A0ACB9IPG2_9ASTR|nr:hypothetical protein L1987_24925 [Smallanthus sonchifolius]
MIDRNIYKQIQVLDLLTKGVTEHFIIMTSKMNSKPRYVRCPRCLNVLAEPTEVPVYKCGGCGTTLQAKKRNNSSTVDTPSPRPDDDSSGKRKVDQVFGDQEAGSSSKQQLLPNVTDESDQNSDHDDLHRLNKDQVAANKAKNDSLDAPSRGVEEYSSGKQKIKQLFDDHEASSSSNQQPLVHSIRNDPCSSTELSGHEDPESSPEATGHNRIHQEQEQNLKQDQDHYQDAAVKQENTTVDATSVGIEHSSGKQKIKIKQFSDDNETSYSLDHQLVVNSINDLDQNSDHNEPSYHEEPDSSPEASIDNRIDDDYNDDYDQVFLSCRHESEFEESGSEFEEAFASTRPVRVSDSNSKSSFKSLIAEKLLDTRQKKPVDLDEDDADLHHLRRFDRISSVETTETARFGGKSYYEYEGSVSSFDGNDIQNPRKYRIDAIGDEHVDSGNGHRFNRRNPIHPSSRRFGKDVQRSTDARSIYGLNPKHRENPKTERIELLRMVRELQNQLERTNISNPQHIPLFNNHVLNNPGRYGQRMAFSGEATAVNRRLESLDGSTYHHCCPRDRPFSAQLPRSQVCCNGPHYRPITYYSPRISGLSSPIHNHSESAFSAPDGYIHRNNDVTKPFHSPKKKLYVRPIAGGSPWIACYRCSKLLELPQSVFVLHKRYHSLKCGACLKELNGPWARPVSCSDRSFQKSYSTETDRNGSWELGEERRKATMSRDPSGSTQPSSSKVLDRRQMTSEGKVWPRLNGSPLHQLMGYASPSKVIRS